MEPERIDWQRIWRPIMAAGLLIVLVSWFVPWISIDVGFFGFRFRLDALFWGISSDDGFESWFSNADEDGVLRIGGPLLAAVGVALTVFAGLAPYLRLPDDIQKEAIRVRFIGPGVLMLGTLLFTIGMARLFDETSMGDWGAGLWLAWLGASLTAAGGGASWLAHRDRPATSPVTAE